MIDLYMQFMLYLPSMHQLSWKWHALAARGTSRSTTTIRAHIAEAMQHRLWRQVHMWFYKARQHRFALKIDALQIRGVIE